MQEPGFIRAQLVHGAFDGVAMVVGQRRERGLEQILARAACDNLSCQQVSELAGQQVTAGLALVEQSLAFDAIVTSLELVAAFERKNAKTKVNRGQVRQLFFSL